MSTPATRAHERLLSSGNVQVRTHEWRPPAPARPIIPENYKDGRRVRIGRRTYGSVSKACRRFSCSPRRIYEWIESGRARFV